MITVTVKITDECEDLLGSLPRGHEYELTRDDGDSVVEFVIHDLDDTTAAIEIALDTNSEVVSYEVI